MPRISKTWIEEAHATLNASPSAEEAIAIAREALAGVVFAQRPIRDPNEARRRQERIDFIALRLVTELACRYVDGEGLGRAAWAMAEEVERGRGAWLAGKDEK